MKKIMKKRVSRDSETGFSIAELMVAVIIMGFLAVGGAIAHSSMILNARDSSAMSILNSEHAGLTVAITNETSQAAEIEAFGIENIGNIGAHKQFESLVAKPDTSPNQLDYSTFLRVSDLSGEVDVVITYKGSTKMFDESEDGIVTASYKQMQIAQNR